MQSPLGSSNPKSYGPSAPCALWTVDLRLTHLDWNPEATLIHFQGHYLTTCELDYNILQGEIQNAPKTKAAVDIGEFCLVEDLTSGRWFRGRVQNRNEDLFDVFLIDHGNVLSVDVAHISSCSDELFNLPPKIVCGFLANVLLLQSCSHSVVEEFFSDLIGRNVTGYIQALLPHKVLLLEAPDVNSELVQHGFGRHVDTDTFLLLVGMLTEVPLNQNIEPVPDLLIEKPRGQEFSFKPSGLQGYEEILSFCGPRLSCGTRAKVRVTAAVNPELFYCQMVKMEADLWEMSKNLAAICEYRTKEQSQKTPENLGLLCSVKGKDGKWYRGFVQFLPVNSQVRVLFIDYGFFESVKVDNVHRLPPDFYSAPVMAFPCSLSASTDQDKVLRTQQLSFLKAGLLGGVLDVEISGYDEEKRLYSVTVFGAEDAHVKEPEPIQKPPLMKVELVSEAEELSPQCGYLYYQTIMSEALEKTLEVEEVEVNSVFVGYVEHAQNPSHFWIRTQKRNDEFEEMMMKMRDHFSQIKLDEDVLVNPKIGAWCCAVYEEDLHFYRGVVTDTLEGGAKVFFIDYGNTEKVPQMLIKNIPEEFASKSAFAICCSLVNVFPFDDVWTTSVSDFFRDTVSNKAFLVHVVQMRKNKFVVDLFEMGCDEKQSVTDLLIASKTVECIHLKPIRQKDMAVTAIKKQSHCSVIKDVSRDSVQWKDCEEEANTCKNETEKAQALSGFKALSIVPGFEFAVCCSYISSPSDFWCQALDQIPALEGLMDKIQQFYAVHTVPLKSGASCCVAKSPQDGRWYRAFITEKHKRDTTVMLVDYGCTVKVSKNNLQEILPEYVNLERQAFRCSLHNLIEPPDPKNSGDQSPVVCNLLKDFILNGAGSLKCKVILQLNVKNKGLCNVVDLYDTQTQKSLTIKLTEQGLAREGTVPTRQLSTVFPESFVYSSFDLSPGNEEQVYVTHVSGPCEIYCHLDRNTEIIDKLEQKISEESENMMKTSTRAVVNKLCLAKYWDGKWYRAVALPVQSPLHLCMFFVDYGNTCISEKTKVLFIPRNSVDLLYTPMQAVRCTLNSVSKEELYTDVKDWLNNAVLNKLVRVVILGKNNDGSFQVDLFDGDVNINQKVRELIQNLSEKPKPAVCFEKGSTKTERKTHHTTHTKTSVKYKHQPKGQSSNVPTSVACRDTRTATTKSKNRNVKQQNKVTTKNYALVKTPKDSVVNQQREYQDSKSRPPPHSEEKTIANDQHLPDKDVSAGFTAKCFVSHIESVNSFFLQLSDDESAILKMGEDLNSGTFRESLKTEQFLRVCGVVLAEYEEDGGLYRSVVKSCEGSSCFKVEFVDYGNSAVVGKEKIFTIPKEYLSQPRFSILCSLLDASLYQNNASFSDAVMEKPLMVDFVRRCGVKWEVKVEILCGGVGPNEAGVEHLTEKKEESPISSSETEDKLKSCEQSKVKDVVCENQTNLSESTAQKPLPITLKVKTNRRARNRKKSKSEKNHGRTKTPSVKSIRDWTVLPPAIQARDTENGTVLSVQSNGSFYIRLTRTSDLLTALETYIADNLHEFGTVAGEDVKEGLKCLVQVQKDNRWQRAVVQHRNKDTFRVLLVDHGLTKEIPSGSIRQQCSNLTTIPDIAVLCKVNSFGFSEPEDAPKLWCETLRLMIGKEVKVVFVSYSSADNLWKVEVVVNGLFLCCRTTASLRHNEERIPSSVKTRNEGGEGPISGPPLDTSPPQQFLFAPVDTEKVYSGFAVAVKTPSEFCVVLEDSLLVMNKVSTVLDNLPERLPPLPEAHLVPGTCCLLKSDFRNKWCRAEIAHSNTSVVLNLVDYGLYERLPYEDRSKLKRLPTDMTNLPKVIYPCVLRGVEPAGVDRQWTDEALVFFQQCLYQNLQIFFRDYVLNTRWMVDVLADGVHVAKKLVDTGHASYTDVMPGTQVPAAEPL